jgi:hypothetical protein
LKARVESRHSIASGNSQSLLCNICTADGGDMHAAMAANYGGPMGRGALGSMIAKRSKASYGVSFGIGLGPAGQPHGRLSAAIGRWMLRSFWVTV